MCILLLLLLLLCLSALGVLRTWRYINTCIYPLSSAVLRITVSLLCYCVLIALCQSMMNKAVFIIIFIVYYCHNQDRNGPDAGNVQ